MSDRYIRDKKIVFILIVITLTGIGYLSFSKYSDIRAHAEVNRLIAKCKNEQSPSSEVCWNKLVTTISRTRSVEMLMDVYEKIATAGDIECHSFGHLVGRITQQRYDNNPQDFFEGKSYSSLPLCGWGFWHGFMASYVKAHDNPGQLKKICEAIPGKFNARYDCLHGVGLGYVGDPPPNAEWGKPMATIHRVMPVCDSMSSDESLRNPCYSGVFHQIIDDMFLGVFLYNPPSKDHPFELCETQLMQYQKECFGQMAPRLYGYIGDALFFSGKPFEELKELPYRDDMIMIAIAGAVNASNTEESLDKFLTKCMGLNVDDSVCLRGIVLGEFGKGDPKAKYTFLTDWCDRNTHSVEVKNECHAQLQI